MAAGGLTGAGGGSIAGTAPPPLQKQPDGAALISYANAGAPKPDVPKRDGGGDKAGADTKAGPVGDGWAQSEEQSQKLQDFDAVRGRPNLGDEQQNDGQEGGEREGSFVGCAAGAAKDVVVGTVKGIYETAKDAGGTVMDKVFRVDGYEGHTERTADRVEAVVDGGKKVVGAGVDAGGAALHRAGVGDFEGAADRTAARGKAIGEAASDEWAEFKAEVDNGDSCALGERVGTTVGVGATVVVGGGALYKGGKVLAKLGGRDGVDRPDGPERMSPDVAKRYDDLKGQGHGPQRHGADVTTQQLEDRVLKGHDPMTNSTTDGVTGKKHRQPPTATRVLSAEDYVTAENNVRGSHEYHDAWDAARENGKTRFNVRIPLDRALGDGAADKVEGKTRIGSKEDPEGAVKTDMNEGTMFAVYKFESDSNPKLITMYPEPKK